MAEPEFASDAADLLDRVQRPGAASQPEARRPEVLGLAAAVQQYVRNDIEILLGGFAYGDPVAFAHEIIRQDIHGLRVVKSAGGLLVDQLAGAGAIAQLMTSHVWNSVGPRSVHAFRRAVESQQPARIELEELSFGALTCGLFAGAAGLPFMPAAPARGTGHWEYRSFHPDKLAEVPSPFGGNPVTVVQPITPDLGVFQVHRVDQFGNCQVRGPLAETRYAAGACRQVLVLAEEQVDSSVIREMPELTVIPGFMVDAVVPCPWAAHPTDSFGYYTRDLAFHAWYEEQTRTAAGMDAYLENYVRATADPIGFLDLVSPTRAAELMIREEPWW
jgi:glutaconate CoA-transferase subunit A